MKTSNDNTVANPQLQRTSPKLSRGELLLFLAPLLALSLFMFGKHYQENYSYIEPVSRKFTCGDLLLIKDDGRRYEAASCTLELRDRTSVAFVFDGYSFPKSSVSSSWQVDGRRSWRQAKYTETWRDVIAGIGQTHSLQYRYLSVERRLQLRYQEHRLAYSHHEQVFWANGRAFPVVSGEVIGLLLTRGRGVERVDIDWE